MAKYIKREMPDLNGTGQTQAYYEMEVYRNISYSEFVERCTLHGGMQRSTIVGTLAHVCHELALQIAMGYSVTIDGLGTFGAKLGVRPDKEQDAFEEGEQHRNVRTIEVNGISYRADKELVRSVDEHCSLERGDECRLRRSPFTPEERVARAREFLTKHAMMRTRDYAQLTGLSYTTAARELCALCRDEASGITSRGRKSAKVYLLRQ